jgi:hypothetical protein
VAVQGRLGVSISSEGKGAHSTETIQLMIQFQMLPIETNVRRETSLRLLSRRCGPTGQKPP